MSGLVYYLAGPMAGYEDHNHPAFHEAAAKLRTRGYKVVNPAEYGNIAIGWQECMKRDIHALLWCDAVIVLPRWGYSRGAHLEVTLAYELEMLVYEYGEMFKAEPQPLKQPEEASA